MISCSFPNPNAGNPSSPFVNFKLLSSGNGMGMAPSKLKILTFPANNRRCQFVSAQPPCQAVNPGPVLENIQTPPSVCQRGPNTHIHAERLTQFILTMHTDGHRPIRVTKRPKHGGKPTTAMFTSNGGYLAEISGRQRRGVCLMASFWSQSRKSCGVFGIEWHSFCQSIQPCRGDRG